MLARVVQLPAKILNCREDRTADVFQLGECTPDIVARSQAHAVPTQPPHTRVDLLAAHIMAQLGIAPRTTVGTPHRAVAAHRGDPAPAAGHGHRRGGPVVGLVISNGCFPPKRGCSQGFDTLALAHNDARGMAAALRARDGSSDVGAHVNRTAAQMRSHVRTAARQLETNGTLFIVLCSHGAACAHGFHYVAGTDWRGPEWCDRGAVSLNWVLTAVADRIMRSRIHNATVVVVLNTCRTPAPCRHAHAARTGDSNARVFGTHNTRVITAYACQPGVVAEVCCALRTRHARALL